MAEIAVASAQTAKRIAKIDEEMDKIDRQIMEKERQIKEEKTREKQEREKENKLIDKSDKQRKTKKINGVEWFLEKEKGEKKPKTGFFGGIKKKFISIEKPSRDVTNHLKKENFENLISSNNLNQNLNETDEVIGGMKKKITELREKEKPELPKKDEKPTDRVKEKQTAITQKQTALEEKQAVEVQQQITNSINDTEQTINEIKGIFKEIEDKINNGEFQST